MKVEFTPDKTVTPSEKFPYLAVYDKDRVILVAGSGIDCDNRSAWLITPNSEYGPFDYFSSKWELRLIKPFRGTLTITA